MSRQSGPSMGDHLDPIVAFPSWQREGSTLSAANTRLGRSARKRAIRRALLSGCFVITIIFITLSATQRYSDRKPEHSIPSSIPESWRMLMKPRVEGNPWRTHHFKFWNPVLRSVSGCGGTYRVAAEFGDLVSLRYVVVERAGFGATSDKTYESDVTIGKGQVASSIESVLQGRCQGEIVRTKLGHGQTMVGYIEKVSPKSVLTSNELTTEYIAADSQDEGALVDWLSQHVIVTVSRKGKSCEASCRKKGLICDEESFKVVNNCPKLRAAFQCRMCEVAAVGAGGADMPAWVSLSAPAGHARGACLVAPDGIKSSCRARYQHTKRLCACLTEHDTRVKVNIDNTGTSANG